MPESYSNYHEYIQGLELARPDNLTRHMSSVYETDLNLGYELANLPSGSIVVDIGCCAVVGTAALKAKPLFCDLHIAGVTPTIIPRNGTKDIPIYQGTAENLSTTLSNCGIFPADVLLMRNVMQEICLGEEDETCNAKGITQDVFKELYKSLIEGGKVLVYDQYGRGERGINFYERYAKLGTEVGFTVEEVACPPRKAYKIERVCPTYIRLIK